MNKLQSVLSDEESMKQIRELADMLSGQGENSMTGETGPPSAQSMQVPGKTDPAPMPDITALLKFGAAAREACANDKNIALLLALRPLMKAENQHKIDKAIKLLRLLDLYPVIKQSGLNGGDLFGLLG